MGSLSTTSPLSAASSRQTLEAISPHFWIGLGCAYLVLGASAWLYAPNATSQEWRVHGLWCCIGLSVAFLALWRMSSRGFDVVLTDHRVMFFAAFSVYFLFGAALMAIGPARESPWLAYYPVEVGDALRVDAVNGIGFGLALLTSGCARGRWLGSHAGKAAALTALIPRHWVIGSFLLLGAAASFYLLPFDLGFREGFVPGVVRAAAKFALVAIVLMFAYRGRGESAWRFAGAVTVIVLVVAGVLQFNKTEALLPLGALTVGLAMRFDARRVFPVGLVLMIGGYLLLGNLALYGRWAIRDRGAATWSERWEVIQEGWAQGREQSEGEAYGAWARLCYVPSQLAGLQFRDEGEGGDGSWLMWWVVVPRLIAPSKPEISKTGRDLHVKLTGQDTSSDGLGVFASGYYHGGWLGVLLASVLSGWIIAQTSAIARSIQLHHGILLLPLSLLGLFIAFRIDGDVISDYLGAFQLILFPLLAVAAIASAARSAHRP